ncbi:hypothetical protein IE81DRAFT_65492 [Ceraceosorus guamensis]|uniref:Protein YOP1 n=1 Tax=Ceraceosorus guamensis TaxID=1522189 RepID=A0A316W1G3_9BASI|nr:hypothetical protein IE81DRAFT_65492 [Ceraceosorus guamensis]PWN43696.1 hypothetical protein IE81DRAFT_65492 [Ceraceosorus guamensis]
MSTLRSSHGCDRHRSSPKRQQVHLSHPTALRNFYNSLPSMAAQLQVIQQKAEYFVSQVDKELSKYPQLVRLEQTVPVPKAYAAIGGFGLFTLVRKRKVLSGRRPQQTHILVLCHLSRLQFVFFNIFAGFLTNLVGFVLPAYFSMKALESPQPQDDVQWLTYWVVFGFFNFIESFVDLILYALRIANSQSCVIQWFPFYYTFKTFAIVWLMLPQTQGAKLIYHRALRPLLAQTGSRSAAAPVAPTAADVN